MNKLLQCKIDVTKIDKKKLFQGNKGTYLAFDIWFNEEPDQYGNNCSIKQSGTKTYIGNGKFYVPKEKSEEELPDKVKEDQEELSNLPF